MKCIHFLFQWTLSLFCYRFVKFNIQTTFQINLVNLGECSGMKESTNKHKKLSVLEEQMKWTHSAVFMVKMYHENKIDNHVPLV